MQKQKNILFLSALLSALWAVSGCETSNQDYGSSAKVVQVTKPASSSRVQQAQPAVYSPGRQSSAQVARATPVQQSSALPAPVALEDQPVASGQSSTAGTQSAAPAYSVSTAATPAVAAAVPVVSASSASAQAVPSHADTYTVLKGDTLYSIAFRYGLDFRALARVNGLQPPYNISVGQTIKLNQLQSRAPTYKVKKGDTLYSIAKAHGQSVAFLAGVNDLTPPYAVNEGQTLLLARADSGESHRSVQSEVPVAGAAAATAATTAASQSSASRTASSAAAPQQVSTTTVLTKPVIVSGKTRRVGGIDWMWPASGKVVEGFSTAEQGNKGLDIAGTRGQRVLAAADGQVVYAGNALRGYGNLVIINHANEYLSAYAHNEVLQVKEGQRVKRGQQIARMGSTDASTVKLHFEIRYRGQSVNPAGYLPE